MTRTKLSKLLAVLLAALMCLTVFAACTEAPGGDDGGVKTESYVPSYNVYDYYADVFGLTANSTGRYFARYRYNKYGEDLPGETPTNQNDKYYDYFHPFKSLPYTAFLTFLNNTDTGKVEASDDRRSDATMGIKNATGDYLFFFGGEAEAKTKPALTAFNDVLAEIFLIAANDVNDDIQYRNGTYDTNFFTGSRAPFVHVVDFNVGGNSGDDIFDIRTDTRKYGSGDAERTITQLYKNLLKQPLSASSEVTKLEGTAAIADATKKVNVSGGNSTAVQLDYINSPSIMIIRKDTSKTVGNGLNTVVDFIDAGAVDFNNTTAVGTFKTAIKELLKKKTNGEDGSKNYTRPVAYDRTADPAESLALRVYDYATDGFARYAGESRGITFNASGKLVLPSDTQPLFTPIDLSQNNRTNMNHRFSFMTYNEYIALLKKRGNFAVLVANQGCPYFAGTIRNLDFCRFGSNIPMIYSFDMCLDGANGGPMNIRDADSKNIVARLYPKMLAYYGEQVWGFAFLGDSASGAVTIGGKAYLKLSAPHFILYNKDNVDINGKSKPVLAIAESGPHHTQTREGSVATGTPDEFSPASQGKRAEFFFMFNQFRSGQLTYRLI